MIGNDIVDLSAAVTESNWRRRGFLEKVFSKEEQTMILSSPVPDEMTWLLWSLKEAAYKAHQRIFGHPPILNWRRQKCELNSLSRTKASGKVTIEGENYLTTSKITSNYIHTSAISNKNRSVKNSIFEASSEVVKHQLLLQVASHFFINPWELSIQKSEYGVPFICYQNQTFFTDFSFSDHGRYSGFSVSLRIS